MIFSRGSSAIDYIIAGLGNPGKNYENTRHNAGFIALDELACQHNIRVDRLKWNALTGTGCIGGARVLLMKPQTFMNNSGEAVAAAMRFYKIPADRLIVILDDISLEPGVLRIRRKGSDGGQRGMRSIIQHTGSEDIPRIKLGIGKKPCPEYDLAEWVTSRFTQSDREKLDAAVRNAVDAVPMMLDGRFEQAMNRYSH